MDSYRRNGIAPTESASEYASTSTEEHIYAHTLRDPSTGAVCFRTNDAELAQRYARALAKQALTSAMDAHEETRLERLVKRVLGIN